MCYDAEPPVVWRESKPKARKPHCCCECNGTIQPGERYSFFEGLWDGRFSNYRTCLDCEELRKQIMLSTRDPYDPGPAFGGLCEEVFESGYKFPEWVKAYMDTRRKRGVPPSRREWMEKLEQKILELPHDTDSV